MGEKESEPFQFTFNGFLKVAFQGSRITSDAGLILVRELDERLGLESIMAAHLSDSRHGLNTQFRLPDVLRQSIYATAAWRATKTSTTQPVSRPIDGSPDRITETVGPECSAPSRRRLSVTRVRCKAEVGFSIWSKQTRCSARMAIR